MYDDKSSFNLKTPLVVVKQYYARLSSFTIMGKLKNRMEVFRLYHIPNCSKYIRCRKNSVRFNTHNSKEHEMMKASVCYDIQKSGGEFITEACRNDNGDVVDVVNLDSGEEWEIVNTHGIEKAVVRGRQIIRIHKS